MSSKSFKASETFWRNFYALPDSQKQSAREAWEIFKENPFDARLKTHKIFALTGRASRTIWSSVIEGDLRVVFYIDGDTVFTVDIGTHDVYE